MPYRIYRNSDHGMRQQIAEIFNNLFVGDIWRDVAKGEGEKIGPEPDGDFGWEDITADVTVRGVGSSDPSWSQVGTGPFYAYKFAVGDECWMCFHIPHDIVPSSDIYFHTHWLPDGTNVQPVKWQYTYTYAKGFDQEAFSSTGTTVTAQGTPPGTAYQHMVTETTAVTIPTLTEPDGLIYVHIKRITNGGTDNANGIFMFTSDVHYQSTGIKTKGKAPDFYT